MKKLSETALILVWIALTALSPALAGPYTDRMSTCLVENTTNVEKSALIQWTVLAYSKHPSLVGIVSVNPSAEEGIHRNVADIFSALMFRRCDRQLNDAIKYEGNAAVESSFTTLGIVAGRELVGDATVNKTVMKFIKYVDKDELYRRFKQ